MYLCIWFIENKRYRLKDLTAVLFYLNKDTILHQSELILGYIVLCRDNLLGGN